MMQHMALELRYMYIASFISLHLTASTKDPFIESVFQ